MTSIAAKVMAAFEGDSSPTELNLSDFSENELIALELLRDQEIDVMADQGIISKDERWNAERRNTFDFIWSEIRLKIATGILYPVKPLSYQITNLSLPRVVVDQLRVALREITVQDAEANTFDKWKQRDSTDSGCFDFIMAALHISAKTDAHLKMFRLDPMYWRNQTNKAKTDYHLSLERRSYLWDFYGIDLLYGDPDEQNFGKHYDPLNPSWSKKISDLTDEQKLIVSEVQHRTEIEDSMFGIDPASVQGHETANALLGKTPEELCKKIPETFRIFHIECVLRSDLSSRFQRTLANIKEHLERLPIEVLKESVKPETRRDLGKRANEEDILVDILIAPELSFHCTRNDFVSSIVRQGFLKPADVKDVRCGSIYGRSIYSSPDPVFSLMYTQYRFGGPTQYNEFAGLKLIVCATIMGRCRFMTREDGWRDQSEAWPGAHSHIANDLMEYVLSKNPAAYINDYRSLKRKEKYAHQKLGLCEDSPGEKQRRKTALRAQAQKYFPYGFGPATGLKFEVLDVGEVSDDEEEYGQYQKDKVDGAAKVDIWAEANDKGLALNSDIDEEEIEEDDNENDEITLSQNANLKGKEIDGEEIAWEYQVGPEGRTKFDEYYEARKAKSKKQKSLSKG